MYVYKIIQYNYDFVSNGLTDKIKEYKRKIYLTNDKEYQNEDFNKIVKEAKSKVDETISLNGILSVCDYLKDNYGFEHLEIKSEAIL